MQKIYLTKFLIDKTLSTLGLEECSACMIKDIRRQPTGNLT